MEKVCHLSTDFGQSNPSSGQPAAVGTRATTREPAWEQERTAIASMFLSVSDNDAGRNPQLRHGPECCFLKKRQCFSSFQVVSLYARSSLRLDGIRQLAQKYLWSLLFGKQKRAQRFGASVASCTSKLEYHAVRLGEACQFSFVFSFQPAVDFVANLPTRMQIL